MLDHLRRLLVRFHTQLAVAYDQMEKDPTSLLNILAMTHDNRQNRESPVRMEQNFIFPEVYRHGGGEVITGGTVDRLPWVVVPQGYNAVMAIERISVTRPSTVITIQQAIAKLPLAYQRKQIEQLMNVFRANPLSADGQNFFDTDHTHPAGLGTYSNILNLTAVEADTPTFTEAQDILRAIRKRFVTNNTLEAQVLRGSEIEKGLQIIVHNAAHFEIFEQVRTERSRSNIDNPLAGTFEVMVDARPTSGQENYLEAIWSEPGGARPCWFVPDLDPVLDAWEDNRMSDNYYAFGLRDGSFGVKAGEPKVAVQVRLTDA